MTENFLCSTTFQGGGDPDKSCENKYFFSSNGTLLLDDIVKMVVHRDTIPEVKDAYVNFLTHCYIDTEVEMKEIYTSNHMWDLFEKSFLLDMAVVSNATHDRKHADTALEHYVTHTLTDIITTFFKSPFSDQSTTVQTRQSVFVQLLGAVFRVAQCSWLTSDQRLGVENCIKTLADVAKSRGIAIPSELDIQVGRQVLRNVKHSLTCS